MLSRQDADRSQCGHVGDAAQDDRRAEQRQESVGCSAPAFPGLREVLQTGQDEQALATSLAHHGRQIRYGRNVGNLVERQQRGRADVAPSDSGIGGVAHVTEKGDDEGRELTLPSSGGADVESICAACEGAVIRGWRLGGLEDALGAIRGQDARCRRPDSGLFPRIGGHDAGQEIAGHVLCTRSGQDLESLGPVVAVDPSEEVPHTQLLRGGGVQKDGQQRSGTLGPVVLARPQALMSAGSDHGVRRRDRRVPIRRAVQWRPPDPFHSLRALDFSAGVVEKRPTLAAARGGSGAQNIRLGRRRHHRSVGEQDIGDDQGRCLP